MLVPTLNTAPVEKPISVDDVKAASVIEFTDDDDLIQALIDAAVDHVDGYAGILGRALINQTWDQSFACLPEPMRLPLAPVSSIAEIKYFDTDNAEQTLDAATYSLFTDALGPHIIRAPNATWPSTYSRVDAVTVSFVTGYGANAAAVPASIRRALLLMVGDLYAFRETVITGTIATKVQTSATVNALLSNHRRVVP